MRIGNGEFWLGDCLDLMARIPDGSVDMVLCDLPYGTTIHKNKQGTSSNKWDFPIDWDDLWRHYKRVLKNNGNVILTAAQPFTSHAVLSNIEWFKYSMVWEKSRVGGFFDVKYRPLKSHEDVLVFSPGGVAMNSKVPALYRPQGVREIEPKKRNDKRGVSSNIRTAVIGKGFQTQTDYPRSVIKIDSETKTVHPTQKPVALFEYLIKTYTDEGMLVLDNCAGSGTTAIAAERTNRRWICIEQLAEYYYPAIGRVWSEVHQ